MENYKGLLKDILENGVVKEDRTGTGTISVFGRMLRWDLSKGFPAITIRRVPFRFAFEETMFFLRGDTDTTKLEEKGIKIWTGNTTREFLDNAGLSHLPVGNMGKGYGFQWRNWEQVEIVNACDTIHHSDGSKTLLDAKVKVRHVDQLAEVINSIQNLPHSRRHIISAWNVGQLNEMALPPCHYGFQFNVNNGKLDCLFNMRSTDAPYGLPFNMMSYAFITHALAKLLKLEVGDLVYSGADVHIYQNQIDLVKTIVERECRPLPSIQINKELNTIEDLLSLEFTDVKLVGYDPHPDIDDKPPMAV